MTAKNKMLTITAIALFIAAFFTATQPLRPEMAIVSSVFVVLFALPSYWAVTHAQGWKRGLTILGVLGFYGLLIESSAIHTGFPYGAFIYNDLLGEKVFGLTPWTVAFAWPPILLLAFWFVRSSKTTEVSNSWWKTGIFTAFLAMSVDLVLDPAAVYLGFWEWREPGFFYGVPLVNFLGWLLSCFIGAIILHFLWGKTKVPEALSYSGIAVLWFWTVANIFMLQVIPVVVGFALLYVFFRKIHLKNV
jgi:putative membrane protein